MTGQRANFFVVETAIQANVLFVFAFKAGVERGIGAA